MNFLSAGFLIFFPIVVILNFIVPSKLRKYFLLLSSYVFYGCIDPKLIVVPIIISIISYVFGILISNKKNHFICALGCIILTCILFFFKYSAFGAIGTSFIILQGIGYLIDVYKGEIEAEKDFIDLALFISFFVYVVSGPIERAGNILKQIKAGESTDFTEMPDKGKVVSFNKNDNDKIKKASDIDKWDTFRDGLLQMLWGYILKMVLADRFAIMVSTIYDTAGDGTFAGTGMFIGTICYSLQIYLDFCGYSCMGIGAARVLGFKIMDNFKSPYLSGSITEFWHRWHISLSSWLRDYVYINLGGSRCGNVRKFINILIVFLISGIWHGNGMTFVIWGLLHGIYQIIGNILKPIRDKGVELLKINRKSFSHRVYKVVFTFLLVNFAWIFFRANSIDHAFAIIRELRGFTPWILFDKTIYDMGMEMPDLIVMFFTMILVVVCDVYGYMNSNSLRRAISNTDEYLILQTNTLRYKILRQSIWMRWIIAISGIVFVVVFGLWGPGYNAENFIYGGF